MKTNILAQCLNKLLASDDCAFLFQSLVINPELLTSDDHRLSRDQLNRAQVAMLMSMLLFKDLLERVPEGQAYANETVEKQQKITFDHGALRTISIDMKHLPSGKAAFSRLLEPLGYELTGKYPLEKLKMCGFVYTHKDYPEDIPQYFISELYPEKFSPSFQKTVRKLVYDSIDPLTKAAQDLLKQLAEEKKLCLNSTTELLKVLPKCFERQHGIPRLDQYKQLLTESAEMAWIATEGNAFNHATDRVKALDILDKEERSKGRHMKPQIEEGLNANIRQTAYRASVVERTFKEEGNTISIKVPGSFFEFIERGTVIDLLTGKEKMDLRFDSRNAQGIFKMTENKKA